MSKTRRVYDPGEMVALPSGLNAQGCLTLGTALETAAKPHKSKLPKLVSRALKDLVKARDELKDYLGPQLDAPAKPTRQAKEADTHEDRALRICDGMLAQLARLPGDYPSGAKARELRSRLFPAGVGFTNIEYKLEWAEADKVLQTIEKLDLEADLTALVGRDVVAYLHSAHETYGKVLGITAPKQAAAPAAAAAREHMAIVTTAIRRYVVRVVGNADPEEEESQQLADELLRPLAEWESARRVTESEADQPSPGEQPAPPAPAGTAPTSPAKVSVT